MKSHHLVEVDMMSKLDAGAQSLNLIIIPSDFTCDMKKRIAREKFLALTCFRKKLCYTILQIPIQTLPHFVHT